MMNDLISRKALCDYALNQKDKSVTPNDIMRFPSAQSEPIKINIDDFNKEDLERFKKELGNTPITVLPAQPEIIRCRDCIAYQEGIDIDGKPFTRCNGINGSVRTYGHTLPDWYCADAERRTDG